MQNVATANLFGGKFLLGFINSVAAFSSVAREQWFSYPALATV
jgi:hypothetical protein